VDLKTRVLGADTRQTLVVKSALADVLRMENKLSEAEKICRESLDAERRVMGADHSDTLVTQNALGQILLKEHRYPEAEAVFLDTLARRSKTLGAKHPDTAETEYNLAGLCALQGKTDDAFLHLNRSLEDAPKPDLYDGISQEPNFNSLHSDPRFADFLARAKKQSAEAAK
jgi:predicted Zn-dependent protease